MNPHHKVALATCSAALAAATLVTPATSSAQSNLPAPTPAPAGPTPTAAPCAEAEHRQFDFWIGDWDVIAPDGAQAGSNVIEPVLGGCALQERWSGRGGFVGTSLNSYSAATKQWHQHWVDGQGGLLRLAGGMEGGRMVLGSRGPDPTRPAATVQQRIAWTPLPDGAVRQLWEQSDDEGQTWTLVFDGRYVRRR